MAGTGRVRVASPGVIAKAELHEVDIVQIAAAKGGVAVTEDDVSSEYLRRELAERLGLPSDATPRDVMAGVTVVMAGKKRRADAAARIAAAAPAAAAPTAVSAPRSHPRGPAYAANPLVDQMRVAAAQGQTTMPSAAAPTLFASGDLPTFTASGVAPQALLEVPWEARHAMAAAPTSEAVYAIREECSYGDDAGVLFSGHPGNEDYRQRVRAWQAGHDVNDAQFEELFGAQLDALVDHTNPTGDHL